MEVLVLEYIGDEGVCGVVALGGGSSTTGCGGVWICLWKMYGNVDCESLEGLLWVLWGVPIAVCWVAAKPYEDCVSVGMQVSLILPACV